ncbi:MAG: hypothetical protein K8R89_09385 [Anaerolineae bacterium]|nr:hypothetical protein [Anaerolineae bacterium]
MPSFPSYAGPPLPAVLNPLNPRHYLMLADWIFFKPSRLKQYLYRADPELYFQSVQRTLVGIWRVPAYRSLWLMMPVLILLISAVAAAAVSWAASATQETAVDWAGMTLGVAFGVAFGVAMGVAMGVAGGVAVGVAGGVAFGVAFGVAGGVA